MKKFILILLLAVFGDSIHARTFENSSKLELNSSLDQDVCENIQPDEIKEVVHQLNLVDDVLMRDSYEIILLLSNDFNNTIKLLHHLRETSIEDLKHLLYENPNEEYFEMARESLFLSREKETIYYVYPGMNEVANEVFAKFVTYKILEKAHHMKIVLMDINPAPWNSNIPFDPESKAGTELKKLIQNAGKIIPQVKQYNGSIGLLKMYSDFKDLSYFVYEFDDDDNIMGCNKCVKLDILPKLNDDSLMKRKTFSPSESLDNFHDAFNDVVHWRISQTVVSVKEKHLDFTFSENQKLTRTMKCVEKKVEENLISDVATVTQLIKTYYSELSKDFTRTENLLEKLKESDLPFSIKDALRKDESQFNTYVDIMRRSFKYLEIKNMDEILSRIERQIETLNFLRSGRNMKMHAFQLLNPVVNLHDNTILKSILLYRELFYLYEDTVYYKPDDLGEILDLNNFMATILGTETKCVPMENTYSDGKNKRIYKLQLRGSIVRFSDIPNFTIYLGSGNIKFIEVFARDSIYIDKDFNSMGNSLQFVTIAPRLWVIGERTINLTGADGKEHENPTAETGETGSKGDDGLAGLPGEPGGIFVVLSEEIINEDRLRILANGGTGGPGQRGGEGGEAMKIEDPDPIVKLNRETFSSIFRFLSIFSSDTCMYYFRQVAKGGDGGNGGVGGWGGKPGKIISHLFKNNSTTSKNGIQHSLLDGNDGEGGLFGKTVDGKEGPEKYLLGYCSRGTPRDEIYPHWTMPRPYSTKGEDGESGSSDKDKKQPTEFKPYRNFASVVNDYKKFIRPFLNITNGTDVATKFFMEIINNEDINNEYGTFELLDELRGLEEQYMDLMEKMDIVFIYENLCTRIGDYAQHRLESEQGQEFVIALRYAYTAALSKANRLQGVGNLKAGFIYDIKDYLDKVSDNLSKLRKDVVQYKTNEMGKKYQENFVKSIQEGEKLIKSELRLEIEKTNKLMRKQIADLFIEVRDMKEESILKREALNRAMKQQSILAVLKVVIVAATVAFPPAGLYTAGAFTAVQIAGTFVSDDPKEDHTVQVPASVGKKLKGAYEFVQESRKKRLEDFKKQRDFLDEQRKKLKIESGDLSEISEKYKELENNRQNLANQILEIVKTKEEQENETEELKFAQEIEIASKVGTYLVHNNSNYAMTDDLAEQAGVLKQMDSDITAVDADLKNLEKMENQIYKEFEPVIECMFKDLPSDETLKKKSSAALDISKWKVQGALKKVKEMVKKFTEGFEVSSEMIQLIVAVEDAMNTMIGIYDQIQNIQREKTLVAYLDAVQNADFEHLFSKNIALEQAVRETRISIRKNIALIQYERAFKSFKQFVFPFARDYLNESTKPSALESKDYNDISTFIISVSEKIDYMREKLDRRGEIDENDPFSISYDRNSNRKEAFYVWKNETYNDMISNLLDGKEVTVYLDPRKFAQYAVKFKEIRIDFITRDEKNQEKLDRKLESLMFDMKHMGNSYYTCGGKMYLISHEKIPLEQGFDRTRNAGTDTLKNLARGKGMASPFATWRIKLSRLVGKMEKNYLAEFKNKVDLFFEGTISYVRAVKTDICNAETDLSEFYREYDPIIKIPLKNVT